MAVLKSPKNVQNKKIWTRNYGVKFRKTTPYPQLPFRGIKPELSITEKVSTYAAKTGSKKRTSPFGANQYGYFYSKKSYWLLWWRRREEFELTPNYYLMWLYHYNTYVEAKYD